MPLAGKGPSPFAIPLMEAWRLGLRLGLEEAAGRILKAASRWSLCSPWLSYSFPRHENSTCLGRDHIDFGHKCGGEDADANAVSAFKGY